MPHHRKISKYARKKFFKRPIFCMNQHTIYLRNCCMIILALAIIIALLTKICTGYHVATKKYYIREEASNVVETSNMQKGLKKESEDLQQGKKDTKKYQLYDLAYFPVSKVHQGKTVDFSYTNTWGGSRSYGGERQHEGIDVMSKDNLPGVIPIVSMSDGVIEAIGWLELGGYRIGIRGKSGAYYYYAHLAQYAQGLEEGDTVRAGQVIGMMGNTGYSNVEGTTGNFPVHLHIGIYIQTKKEKMKSVNPYYILTQLEKYSICTF